MDHIQHSSSRSELYRLMAITLMFSIAMMMINPILPLYIVELGATKLELGLIMSISSLSGIVLRIPFGIASDRLERKFLMFFSLLVYSIALVFLSMVRSLIWLYPAALLLSIPWASYMPSSTAAVMDLAPSKERGMTMGIYFSSFGTATILGPLLTSVLVKFLSYRKLLLTTSVFPAIALAILLQGGLRRGPIGSSAAKNGFSLNILGSIKHLIRSRSLIGLSLGRVLYSTPNFVFATLFPVYANKELLMTASMISLLYTARGAANALSRLPSGKLCDVIKPKRLLLLAYLISSIFY
ncbi:MAG TPA: MFS transporter, partial [Candidatus Korarchaeota archaeon]|nr:MFS transporter [Candidatus Korarchaeota archaeon]